MTLTILFFILGLLLLIAGAELLVRGASRLASSFGVSPLVIGLTIVAIGTASPEIAVSLQAAVKGQGDLTLGNVLGSNIFNILFILGITSILTPIVIAKQLIRKDAPILLGISLLTFFFAMDGSISKTDGIILLIGLLAYFVFVIRESRKESKAVQNEYAEEYATKQKPTSKNVLINLVFIIIGLGLLVVGSNWLVQSAVQIAQALGVSELVIGLTIVAIGTSLPEVATSVIAALKKESDIAVGNAIGSNIFNLLGVLGLGAFLAPQGISVSNQVLQVDLPVMVFVALVTLPIFYIDNRISKLEGGLLLSYYVLYIAYILIKVSGSSLLPSITQIVTFFAPITFIALVVIATQSYRQKRKKVIS